MKLINQMRLTHNPLMSTVIYIMVEWQAIEGKHLIKIILQESVSFQKLGHIIIIIIIICVIYNMFQRSICVI